MAVIGAQVPENELMGILTGLMNDEQDSVRMQLMETCVIFARGLSATKLEQIILPMVKFYAADRSWRIRYTVTEQILELISQSGP